MTEQLRRGLITKVPAVELKGEVEIDKGYVVAGHKGQPQEVARRGGLDDVAGWQVRRDVARWRRTSHQSSARLVQGSAKRSLVEWPDEG